MEIIKPWENFSLVVVDHVEEIFPRPLHIIERSSDPYWQERGWIKIPIGPRGCSYHGYYSGESFLLRGLIEEEYFPHTFEFFIFNPSVELQKSPHWQCFNNYKGNNKFCIHFYESPEDVCAGIIEIERIIAEAYRDY